MKYYRKKIKNKKPCFLCKKHEHITEIHHINEFKNHKEDLLLHNEYKSELISLCPNCHRYVHKTLYNKDKNFINDCFTVAHFFDSVSIEKKSAMSNKILKCGRCGLPQNMGVHYPNIVKAPCPAIKIFKDKFGADVLLQAR